MSSSFTASTQQVVLHVYDLSQGMARALSPQILGKQIDAIYHTGVAVFDREYYFGGGICSDATGQTPYGNPIKRLEMGVTTRTKVEFHDYLLSINHRYTMTTYHLLTNNCNNFSDTVLAYLTEKRVPQYILDLPRTAMESPLGPFLEPMINQMQNTITTASIGHEIAPSGANGVSPSSSSPQSSSPGQGSSTSSYPTLMAALKPLPTVPAPPNLSLIHKKLGEFAPNFTETDSIPALIELLPTIDPSQSFPPLDLLRCHALASVDNAKSIAKALTETLVNTYILSPKATTPSKLMTLRACINAAATDKDACEIVRECKDVHEVALRCLEDDCIKVRLTAPLPIVNLAKGGHERIGEEDGVGLVWAVAERLGKVSGDSNEAWGLLVALGALIIDNDDFGEVVKAVEVDLEKFTEEAPEKRVKLVAKELSECLSQ